MKKLLIAAIVALAGAVAFAQTARSRHAGAAAANGSFDADKVMTRDELVAKVREHFGRIDANNDGSMTTPEIAEARGSWSEWHQDGADRTRCGSSDAIRLPPSTGST